MKMAHIDFCDASECSYNMDNHCHALAITIGDSRPMCDTYCCKSEKGGNPSAVGMVGACKVSSCAFNSSLECSADTISLGHQGNEIDCLCYKQR